jgi:glycosyltransferase involved in cell wall biosynthesis
MQFAVDKREQMNSHSPSVRSKVIFVNRFFYPDQSATSQMLSDLSIGLATRGYRIQVVCSRQLYDEPQHKLAARALVAGVDVHRIWTTRFGRVGLMGRALDYASFYLSGAWKLLILLRRGDTVVAKTDPPMLSIMMVAIAKAKGAHVINWLQDIYPEVASQLNANPLPRPFDALLRNCRDRSLCKVHMNVVLGERMRDLLQKRGIPSHKLRVIENWAEPVGAWPKSTGSSDLRSRLALADKFVVGYSGNLGRAHEFQTLIDAASLLEAEPGIVFLMIGGGAGMSALQRMVQKRSLRNFLFLPYVPRTSLADSLAAADVHLVSLLPALEGLIVPSKFYGILAAGRPVVFVGDQDGELARIIRASQIGMVVSVGDAPELARRLIDMQFSPARRQEMGEKGHRLYRERYSPQRALDQWAELLDR